MRLPKAIKIFFIAAVYFLLAIVSLQLSFHSSNASPVWPASGFAFAILLLWKPNVAYGIFIGAFSANLYVFLNNHTCDATTAIWVSALIGIGNTANGLIGYYLLEKFTKGIKPSELLRNVHSVNRFAITALVMCLVSCTVGAIALLLGGIVPSVELFMVWFTWWTGDVSGVLLVTPFVLTWVAGKWMVGDIATARIFEATFIIAATIITCGTVFEGLFHPGFVFTRAFIITPFLIWAAIRMDQKLVVLLVIASAAIAITGTLEGHGPFVGPSLNESLITVETFVSINSIMALLLNAAIIERKQKESSLSLARNSLEVIVGERTIELNEKNEQLQKQNNELTLFSYAVSHDLQEPLRKIEFFTSRILEDENNLSDKGKDYFQRMRLTAVRMKQLIENLLSYSIVEGNKKPPEKTDLNLILQQVKMDLAESIQLSGTHIESGPLPVIKGIPFQLHELFINIIGNSIKFRKQGEGLHIRIECKKLKRPVNVTNEPSNDNEYYHLTFTDNGIGFEQEYSNTIFELLQKLHGQNEYGGTGIGLAICKKVVENHKGFISADAAPGKGCTIHVYLPVDHSLKQVSEADRKEREYS
jgi:signal transduction histidine kinase